MQPTDQARLPHPTGGGEVDRYEAYAEQNKLSTNMAGPRRAPNTPCELSADPKHPFNRRSHGLDAPSLRMANDRVVPHRQRGCGLHRLDPLQL